MLLGVTIETSRYQPLTGIRIPISFYYASRRMVAIFDAAKPKKGVGSELAF